MKQCTLISFLFIWLVAIPARPQQWSDPVLITSNSGNGYPDLAVDQSGTLWCVWAHRINDFYWKIYIAHSSDHGETWTGYTDVSRNSEHWVSNPHIAIDTNNHIHVTYDHFVEDYTKTAIHYTMFNGVEWSQPVSLSDGMPGSDYNLVVTDQTNKVYCFWNYGTIRYREKTGNQWGPVITPYALSPDFYYLSQVIVDKNSDLHCAGLHRYSGQVTGRSRYVYWKVVSNHWDDFVELSDTTGIARKGLALRTDGKIAFTWMQRGTSMTVSQWATVYAEQTTMGISNKTIISTDSRDPTLTTDKNDNLYIVLNEGSPEGGNVLVSHFKTGNDWLKEVIETNFHGYYGNQLLWHDPFVYLIATKMTENQYPLGDVQFRKIKTIQGIENIFGKTDIEVFPNPSGHLFYLIGHFSMDI